MNKSLTDGQNHICDRDKTPAAIKDMEHYCEAHPGGPAAVRRPRLILRGDNYIVLLGESIATGIVGIGRTVPAALRAFDLQYLKTIHPPSDGRKERLLPSRDI